MSEATTTPKKKNLNPITLFVGFIPWIAFAVISTRIAADGVAWSALVAAVLSALFIVWAVRTNGPKLLNIYSLVLFTLITVVGFIGDAGVDRWLYEWGRPLVGVVLGVAILVTAPFLPFTAEFARKSTPQEYWHSPLFTRINLMLSAVWGVAVLLMGVCAVLVTAFEAHALDTSSPHLAELFLNWVIPIVLIVGMIRFTDVYPGREREKWMAAHGGEPGAGAPAAGSARPGAPAAS